MSFVDSLLKHSPKKLSVLLVDKRAVEYEDDHMMGRCDAATVLSWIVGVLARRPVAAAVRDAAAVAAGSRTSSSRPCDSTETELA